MLRGFCVGPNAVPGVGASSDPRSDWRRVLGITNGQRRLDADTDLDRTSRRRRPGGKPRRARAP